MIAKYWKSAIAFLGVLATGVTGIISVVNYLNSNSLIGVFLPASVTSEISTVGGILVTVGAIVTGVLAFFVRNQKTVDSVSTALSKGDFSLDELKDLLAIVEGKSTPVNGQTEAP